MIDVSLIIVNWNTEKLLIECIESIIDQTKEASYEIIVVDNASSDNSVETLKKKFPFVTVIENEENLGFSKANNQGIRISKGRLVCLMNTDILVLENTIDKLVKEIDSNDSAGVIVPMTIDRNHNIRENVRNFPSLWNIFCETLFLHRIFKNSRLFHGRAIPTKYYKDLYEVESISGCFMMVKRNAMEEVGLLDEIFFFYTEDVDWCKRFYDAGWKIIYLSNVRSIHYGSESSNVAPAKYQVIMENSDLLYWNKHHSKASVRFYRSLRILKCSVSILSVRLSNIEPDKKAAKIEGFQARIDLLKRGHKDEG